MINLTPLPALHHLRDLVDFNELTAAQLVRERKTAIKSGELKVKDDAKGLMSLLMKSNMTAEAGMRLTDDELVASTSMIVFTATDTTSAALTRLLHVLALYPGVQDKLCAEILAAPEHLDHDALVALPYLDAVIHESLRLYPPVAPALFRERQSVQGHGPPPQHPHHQRRRHAHARAQRPEGHVDIRRGSRREHEQVDMGRGRGGVQARAVGEWEGGGRHDEAVRDLRKHHDVPREGRGEIYWA